MPRRAERLKGQRLLGNGNSGSVKQEVAELIAAYKDHEPVHRLVQRFGIQAHPNRGCRWGLKPPVSSTSS